MKPHEMRAAAAAKKAEADALFKMILAAGRDATPDEEQRHDALLTEAEGLLNQAKAFEAREKRINDLEASLQESQGRSSNPLPHNDPSNTHNGRLGYSVLKAWRQMDPQAKEERLDGIELETHAELLKRGKEGGHKVGGVLLPWDLPVNTQAAAQFRTRAGIERRDLTLTTGAGAIETYTYPTMIEFLRARMLMAQLGAKTMSDMQGNFVLPRQTGASTFAVINPESAIVTKSNATIDGITFSPRTGIIQTVYSRSFLHQTAVDAEMFAREDLALSMAVGLDAVGFTGPGSGAYPYGLLYDVNVNVVPIATNGGAETWALVVALEEAVDVANALLGNLNYVTSAKGRAALKTTLKAANTAGIMLWEDNEVNGYPAWSTNSIPTNLTKGTGTNLTALIFGNFADLVYAFWGGLDSIVNPYSGSASGAVELTVMQDFDFHVRHDKSISISTDFIAA